MKTTVTECGFMDAFKAMGREDQFSYEGLKALFAHLEEMEQDGGEEMELDVIALCCDYTEYKSAREAAAEHGWEADEEDDEDEQEMRAMEWLNERTMGLQFDGGVIIQNF